MVNSYRIFMALHIISVISWMAGILYLYRLFIYHTEETLDVVKERFVVMEERLYRIITRPAMYLSIFFGGLMVWENPSLLTLHWFHVKLFLALLLIGMTLLSVPFRKKLQTGQSQVSSKTFRILNEVPTLLMIGIVFLVILKAF